MFSQEDHTYLYKNSSQNISSNQKGYVDLSFLNIAKDDDRDEMYPKQVFAQIKQCINDGFNYSDICVLVRKAKEGASVANYLSDDHQWMI